MSSATNASVVDSSQTSTEGISATAPRALVSPPAESAHASGEAHEDISRTLFNGNKEINVEDIASLYICPLLQEPPFQGVHFDIPDTSGRITEQVFERSQHDSVIEMFAIPPLAQQQVQRQQERPSSTFTTNTSRSTTTSTSNTSQLASTANTSTANTSEGTTTNATRRRSALGGFVFTSNGRSGIRSANHAAGIIGLIQLAGAHPSRWEGTLGHNQRTQ